MLRAVLDTNILVSSLRNPGGRNATLFDAAGDGRFRLITSPALVEELARTLRHKLIWDDEKVQKAVRAVARTAEIIPTHTHLTIITADPMTTASSNAPSMAAPTSSSPTIATSSP